MQDNNLSPYGNSRGFSLVELLVYMGILAVLMGLVMVSFTGTLQRTVQQTGISETRLESHVGLEILRADLEHAGFGLPWRWDIAPDPYVEPGPLADAPNVPRAINSQDLYAGLGSINAADYLVLRSTNIARGASSQTWGYVGRDRNNTLAIQSMGSEAFAANDQVMVIRPMVNPNALRHLVTVGINNNYVRNPTTASLANYSPPPTPNDPDGERYLMYGLRDNAGLVQRPFNRADYYIRTGNVPAHCGPNTGVLVKVQLNQADNTPPDQIPPQPFVDCVADFQLVYYLDTNGDGGWNLRGNANDLNGLTAEQIRDQLKAIRYYILLHEGGIDRAYTYPTNLVNVGEVDGAGNLLAGRTLDLAVAIGGDWRNYRWKVESGAIAPKNLK